MLCCSVVSQALYLINKAKRIESWFLHQGKIPERRLVQVSCYIYHHSFTPASSAGDPCNWLPLYPRYPRRQEAVASSWSHAHVASLMPSFLSAGLWGKWEACWECRSPCLPISKSRKSGSSSQKGGAPSAQAPACLDGEPAHLPAPQLRLLARAGSFCTSYPWNDSWQAACSGLWAQALAGIILSGECVPVCCYGVRWK